jgi:uncharacterized protein (DUF1800 family)
MAIVPVKKRRKKRRGRKHPVAHKVATKAQPKATPKPKPVATTPKKPAATTPTTPSTTPAATGTVDPQTWVSPLPVATSRERLFLNRFGTGFTQTALAQLRTSGDANAWLSAQLRPTSVPEAAKVAAVDSWFASLTQNPATKYANNASKAMSAWQYGLDLSNWAVQRRIHSNRSVLETMTDFWSSHLHIPVGHDYAWVFRYDYDQTIRANALGTFEELLLACALHPAMRMYLDNWKSVRNAPNENQGRELLELHTVGRSAGYTEAMVKDSAKILSGYTVDWGTGKTFTPLYDPTKHTTGTVNVLDFTNANSAADGQAVTTAYLKYLAHHPATAKRIATKLAVYFVNDNPSDGLVNTLASVFTSSGTSIAATLTALANHPEFLASEGHKVRTPYADLVATTRVLAVDIKAPTASGSWANAASYVHGASQLFSWPRPDGPPIDSGSWSSASRLFASYNMHADLSGGWWPTQDATYKSAASWLPVPQVRFDRYVDHLSRLWLGRAADTRLINAARLAVTRPEKWGTVTNASIVDKNHMVAGWAFPRLAWALLDTPDHMTA